MSTLVGCSECRWFGPADESRTQSSCPNCGARYDFDVPPQAPRTHVHLPFDASSACGLSYFDIANRPTHHAFVLDSKEPTCRACANYAALRKINDRQAKSLRTAVAIYLPSDALTGSIRTWDSLLDELDAEMKAVEAQVDAEMSKSTTPKVLS